MFNKSTPIYDAIYSWKDYEAEASRLRELFMARGIPGGSSLLDVACGTGRHLEYLKQYYYVEGLDLDPGLLEVARQRHPDLAFHQADMTNFDLGRQFNIVTCLFSAISYVKTVDRLNRSIEVMSRHLLPGGLLLVEPWIYPHAYKEGSVHATFVDRPDLKIARMRVGEPLQGNLAILNFHYLVATPAGVEYFTERHETALFTHEQYLEAFTSAGLQVEHDPEGLMGRGLYIGTQ